MPKLARIFTAQSAETIRAERDKIAADGLRLHAQIDALESERADAETWESSRALEDKIAELRFSADKAAKLLADAEERLATAIHREREARRVDLTRALSAVTDAYVPKARAALEAFNAVIAARSDLIAAGFQRDADAIEIPPAIGGSPVCGGEILNAFEARIEQRKAAPRPQPQPVRQPAKRAETRRYEDRNLVPTIDPMPRRVTLNSDPPPGNALTRPLLDESARAGEVRIVFTKSNVQFRPEIASIRGDIASVPSTQAHSLVANGAAEFLGDSK